MFLTAALSLFLLQAASAQQQSNNDQVIFPKGDPAPAANFTGQVWVYLLVGNDSIFHLVSGAVTFAPGARSNWHSHVAGQILMITRGTCFYQEKGKPVQVFHKGDVIKCPPNIDHWHGASPKDTMTHIAINPNAEHGVVTWKSPVTDEEYLH